MHAPLKDQTYVVGRERRRRAKPTARERRSRRSVRSQRYLGIPDPSVSRRHAEIVVLNGTIHIRDLGSRNGTFVIDSDTRRKVPLQEGYVGPDQLVAFGDCVCAIGKLLRRRQDGADVSPAIRAGRKNPYRGDGGES